MTNSSLTRWQGASYLYRLVGGLHAWRQSSLLLQWADLLGAAIVSVVLVLAPFVSTALIGVLLVTGALYWGLLTLSDERAIAAVTPVHLLVLLYWGVATVATAFSPVKEAAFAGWVKLTLYLVWFALVARVLRSPRLRNCAITLLLLTSVVVSIYGVRQEIFGAEQLATWNDPESELAESTRAYSYLGNPNLLAGYLLSAIALGLSAVFVWQTWPQKALAATILGVNSTCLYFTDSRGGWIGMLALLLVYFLLLRLWWNDKLPRFWRKWLLPLVFGGLAGFLVVAVLAVEPLRLRVMSIFAGREDSSNNFRLNVWAAVLDMIRDRPLIGIGPGNNAFNLIYPLYQRPNYNALSAYSIYLEVAVETGFIGLGGFLWLLVVMFRQGLHQLSRLRLADNRQGFWVIGAMAGAAGMLAHGLVDTVWYRPQISTLWWLLVALIAGYYGQGKTAAPATKEQ